MAISIPENKMFCKIMLLGSQFPFKEITFMSITNLNMEEMCHKLPIYLHK